MDKNAHLKGNYDNVPRKIYFFGHFGSPNFGNEITLQTILYHLGHRLPEAEFVCICTEPETLAANQKIETVPISRSFIKPGRPRTRFARWLRKIFIGLPSEFVGWITAFNTLRSTDILIIPGTGLLTDAYGLFEWGPYNLFKWALAAKLHGCKVIFVSVGAGPIYTALGKLFVRSALSLADFRSYRDDASRACLKGIGFPANDDKVYPDLVFGLPESMSSPCGGELKKRTVVGLGLMPYAGRYSVEKPKKAVYKEYLENLVIFTQWLLAHDYDIRFLLGEVNDRIVSEEFKVLLTKSLGNFDESQIIDEPALSVEQLLPQIAETDIVVATRFHNVLLALVLNKPAIAISFHHKCTSLMIDMGLAEYCHDINDMNADKLIEQFQNLVKNAGRLKTVLRHKVEQSRNALNEQYDYICKSI